MPQAHCICLDIRALASLGLRLQTWCLAAGFESQICRVLAMQVSIMYCLPFHSITTDSQPPLSIAPRFVKFQLPVTI